MCVVGSGSLSIDRFAISSPLKPAAPSTWSVLRGVRRMGGGGAFREWSRDLDRSKGGGPATEQSLVGTSLVPDKT